MKAKVGVIREGNLPIISQCFFFVVKVIFKRARYEVVQNECENLYRFICIGLCCCIDEHVLRE
jgi:hypothetical protein